MSVKMVRLVSTVSLCAIATAALARDEFDLKVANVEIMRDRAIQDELGITEGQRKNLNGFADKFNSANNAKIAEYQKAKKQPDMAFQKFTYAQYVKMRDSVLGGISDGQLKRLREITIQAAGPRAILDKNVATKIGLTDKDYNLIRTTIIASDQKIAKIKGEVGEVIRKKYEKTAKPKTKAEAEALNKKVQADINTAMRKRQPEVQKIVSASDAKVKTVVKQVHLDKLKALAGKPFVPKAKK
ncbi:MAG: hypothetical protein QE269_03635 [Fimbriimonas sp.]|nr:hypothetical protein [Fimbriimonas sp.]